MTSSSVQLSHGSCHRAWSNSTDNLNNSITLPWDNSSDKCPVVDKDADFISEQALGVFLCVNFWGLGQCVTILGMLNNVLSIVTFLKQGVSDTVNISLMNLAISDLGSLIFLFFWNILSTPSLSDHDLPFYPEQIRWHVGWIHVILIRVSTGITALITFERCLCITLPLAVKRILTPDRTVKCIIVIYFIMIGSTSPMFYTSRYVWVFDSARNKSILGLVYLKNRAEEEVVVFILNTILPTAIFVFIIVCTIILIKTLREKSKWRQRTTSTNRTTISDKETKAVKMVAFISTVFIVCFLPGTISFLWGLMDPDLRPDGRKRRAMYAMTSIMLHMEAINATANFFIYLKMSSKFKRTVREIFCGKDSSGE